MQWKNSMKRPKREAVIAFTSSWGEANPGGGKDRVELFVERSKSNVADARDALGQVVKILGLSD